MLSNQSNLKNLKKVLIFSSQSLIFSLIHQHPLPYRHTQKHNYVDVYMKWKKDPYYDSIESIHKSIELKTIISLKDCIVSSPDHCIPISAVSKKGLELGVPIKVAKFLRQYPSFFEEFTGPKYNLPWFRLTQEAIETHREEKRVYAEHWDDIVLRLKKLILMSVEKRLPFEIIQGMLWYLGLPDEILLDPGKSLGGEFRIVMMEDGLKGLAVESEGGVLSVMQKNGMKRGGYSGGVDEGLAFPLFPSKGLRLRRKISDWLEEFQRLPYISPYEDYSDLRTDSDASEKRVVGVLHELLCLFVEHAAERKKLLCLRKYLGLPQKVHKAFERHPHMFYLSLRNKTCTAILKEAYRDKSAIEAHPIAKVRRKYINLIKESEVILKKRRHNRTSSEHGNVNKILDLDSTDDEGVELAEV